MPESARACDATEVIAEMLSGAARAAHTDRALAYLWSPGGASLAPWCLSGSLVTPESQAVTIEKDSPLGQRLQAGELARLGEEPDVTAQQLAQVLQLGAGALVPARVGERLVAAVALAASSPSKGLSLEAAQAAQEVADDAAQDLALALENGDPLRVGLSVLLDQAADGVLVLDKTGRLLYANQSAERFLRRTVLHSLGLPIRTCVFNQEILEFYEESRGETELCGRELSLRAPVHRVIDARAVPLTAGVSALLLTDVTELRGLDQLKQEFVASVSHELRTPLTSIKAFAATLLRGIEFDKPTRKEFLTVINDQCDRLANLVDDLLRVSRLESGQRQPLNLSTVCIRDLMEKVVEGERASTQVHQFSLETIGEVRPVQADTAKVEQVLANLVSNAIKYSPAGGLVRLTETEVGGYVVVSVSDQGIGIPRSRLDKVFEKFYQLDSSSTRRVGGSGVGLFLCRHFVRAHGGNIWAESEVGKGTTITFSLPVAGPPE